VNASLIELTPAARPDRRVVRSPGYRRSEEADMTAFTVKTIDPQSAAVVRGDVPMEELRTVFDRGFGEVMRVAEAQGVPINGPPFGFYPRMPTDTVVREPGGVVPGAHRRVGGGRGALARRSHVGVLPHGPAAEPDPATWQTMITWPLA
jgi:hypothetical protein